MVTKDRASASLILQENQQKLVDGQQPTPSPLQMAPTSMPIFITIRSTVTMPMAFTAKPIGIRAKQVEILPIIAPMQISIAPIIHVNQKALPTLVAIMELPDPHMAALILSPISCAV